MHLARYTLTVIEESCHAASPIRCMGREPAKPIFQSSFAIAFAHRGSSIFQGCVLFYRPWPVPNALRLMSRGEYVGQTSLLALSSPLILPPLSLRAFLSLRFLEGPLADSQLAPLSRPDSVAY